MEALNNILVVLGDDRDQAAYVLEKAAALASASGATLHAVRIVYEGIADLSAAAIDSSADLKRFILEAEETATMDMLESVPRLDAAVESATLWHPRAWQGMLDAAAEIGADLIVKGASRQPGFPDLVRTPDDWNLLRGATVPVMLVKPDAWAREPAVVCALDVLDDAHVDLNIALLREAASLRRVLSGSLHVVVAYPLFERWVGQLGGLRDYDGLKREIEEEIRERAVALAARADVEYTHLYADEGRPDTVIGALVRDLEAALVVVGTHARQGLKGLVIGNTAERLVHELNVDMVTLPAPSA